MTAVELGHRGRHRTHEALDLLVGRQAFKRVEHVEATERHELLILGKVQQRRGGEELLVAREHP
jgi:hypothetical protein